MPKHALILLTSHTQLGDTGRYTGFYYDEMAAPYWTIRDLGFTINRYRDHLIQKQLSNLKSAHRTSRGLWMTRKL